MKQYQSWINKQLNTNILDNRYDIEEYIEYFLKNKTKFEDKHLENYTIESLKDKINELKEAKIQSLVGSLKENEDYVLIHSGDEYNVFRIHNKKASIVLGRGTTWCTTMADKKHYESYSRNSIFYYLIRKDRKDDRLNKIGAAVNIKTKKIEYYDQANSTCNTNYTLNFTYELEAYFSNLIREDIKDLDILKYYKHVQKELLLSCIDIAKINEYEEVIKERPELFKDILKKKECPIELLKKHSNSKDRLIYGALVSNPNCPPYILRKIANKENLTIGIKNKIAKNKNTTAKVLEILAEKSTHSLDDNIVKNKKCSLKLLNSIFEKRKNGEEYYILNTILNHPNCDLKLKHKLHETLYKLDYYWVDSQLARDSSISEKMQLMLLNKGSLEGTLAANKCIDISIQRRLAKHDNCHITKILAQNTSIAKETQLTLSKHKDSTTRSCLARNKSICKEVKLILAKDKNFYVKNELITNHNPNKQLYSLLAKDETVLTCLAINPKYENIKLIIAKKGSYQAILNLIRRNNISEKVKRAIYANPNSKDYIEYIKETLEK